MAKLDELRARIECDDYAVDADKVAAAIVERLMQVAAPPSG